MDWKERLKPKKPVKLPEDLLRDRDKVKPDLSAFQDDDPSEVDPRSLDGLHRVIPVEDIVVKEQVRKDIDPEGLKELAENISKYGLINPITVRRLPDGKYEVVAGHRRFFAVRDVLGRKAIECRVLNVKSEVEKTAVQISENVHRKDLHPAELADAVGKVAAEFLLTRVNKQKLQENQQVVKNDQDEKTDKLRKLSLYVWGNVNRLTDEEKASVAKVMERCGVTQYQLAISLFIYSLPEDVKRELSKLNVSLKHFAVMLKRQLSSEEVLYFARLVHEKELSSSELNSLLAVREAGKKKTKTVPKGVERVYSKAKSFREYVLKSRYVREVPEVREKLRAELTELLRALDEMEERR
ncbi:ParB/RepB/Spo0J family partition protein [Desulfurobacterium sp.]|uniref:ParB/RepB/Spo0J family partition protein n=1 Tax=Desulfurobacterium sp. TaxID=2004706 RepID=UPI002631E821|nr:ParB/RepB/Spo0J family partition protein [Desulfurobacterium sp.]